MFHPKITLPFDAPYIKYAIIQIGGGGNGGPLVQKLARTIFAKSGTEQRVAYDPTPSSKYRSYVIVDGDHVEERNMLRQPFIQDDVGRYKAEVLAERYSEAYGISIYSKNQYIDSVEDLNDICKAAVEIAANVYSGDRVVPILIGAVDNNATRKIMHDFFMSQKQIIYIDAGVDPVVGDTEEEKFESGYSGHVVCGLRIKGRTILEPVASVYPQILEDKDSLTPTQACGVTVVDYPQRMQSNETAALILHSYLNNIIFDDAILTHYTNFNAQTMTSRPTYITKEKIELYEAN